MFCTNCRKEIEKEWVRCPNCGTPLGVNKNDKDERNISKDNQNTKSRDEIKKELIEGAFSDKSGVILSYGAGGISRDLVRILWPREEILSFCHAYRNSIMGQCKNFRMFRNYIVCTNLRMIYVENGRRAFSLLPFFRKVISFPFNEIENITIDKRLGIYSGKMIVESSGKKNNFALIDRNSAEELRDFLEDMIQN